jgi:hypothetical protein
VPVGHSPQVHVNTYAHAIDAIKGKGYADLDALISAARADLMCRQSAAGAPR